MDIEQQKGQNLHLVVYKICMVIIHKFLLKK